MSKVEITEYALRCAAAEYREAMLAALPKPSECEYEFSDEYYEKRDSLIRKTERRSSLRRICKNVAAVFLVCFLGAGAFLGINGEARADFLRWVREVYENSIIYHFAGEATEAPLPDCELTWIPEGYELVRDEQDENSLTMVYENDNGEGFIFSCDRMTEYSLVQLIPTGDNIVKPININNMSGELYIAADGSNDNDIIWMDNELGIFYYLGSNALDEIVILHIAKNINIAK